MTGGRRIPADRCARRSRSRPPSICRRSARACWNWRRRPRQRSNVRLDRNGLPRRAQPQGRGARGRFHRDRIVLPVAGRPVRTLEAPREPAHRRRRSIPRIGRRGPDVSRRLGPASAAARRQRRTPQRRSRTQAAPRHPDSPPALTGETETVRIAVAHWTHAVGSGGNAGRETGRGPARGRPGGARRPVRSSGARNGREFSRRCAPCGRRWSGRSRQRPRSRTCAGWPNSSIGTTTTCAPWKAKSRRCGARRSRIALARRQARRRSAGELQETADAAPGHARRAACRSWCAICAATRARKRIW